ncbi:MAG: penicillin-binding protein 2 [Thermoleophilaceae bacterium]
MRVVQRRIGLLFALFLVLLLMAAGRATWLGTVRADGLRAHARSQQVQQTSVPARRGLITDRHGTELAVSEDSATVYANPFLIKDPAGTARRLAPHLRRRPSEVEATLAQRGKGFSYLARQLEGASGAAIQRMRIEGIGVEVVPKRVYPQGTLAGQLLGAVGTDGYGLSGLEQAHERALRGRDGERKVVKDALGKPVSIVETEPAESGRDLRLTIDAPIQERVEAVLAELGRKHAPKGATALVMDPRNGEILAMANWPPVDPERFGSTPVYARQNRAVAANYEPGSTFKAFTVAGALEERTLDPETTFDLPPTITVADRTIEESHERGTVTLSVAQILAASSNVGSVTIGLELGSKRFDRWVRRFGFGGGTDVDVPGEAQGIVPRPSEYSGSSMGNLPIGQGLAVTPMQMAMGYQAIAMGGVTHTPHVTAGTRLRRKRVISVRTATQVSRMLEGVLGAGGTAQEARVPGYRLAGKTGTAEKPDGFGGYSNTKYVSSFIGYAPARRPRLLVTVMVDEPKGEIYGGLVAAPAFEKIVSFALPYMRIPPEG